MCKLAGGKPVAALPVVTLLQACYPLFALYRFMQVGLLFLHSVCYKSVSIISPFVYYVHYLFQ